MTTQHHDGLHRLASAEILVGVDRAGSCRPRRPMGRRDGVAAGPRPADRARPRPRRLAAYGIYDVIIPPVIDAIRREGADLVRAARHLAHQVDPTLTVETEVSEANPALLLIELSKTAHTVAIGAAGSGGTLSHLGSTLFAVAGHGRGPIVVVRDTGTEQQPRHIGPVVVVHPQ